MGLGYSAEHSDIKTLVDVAEVQEAAMVAQRHFNKVRPQTSLTKKKDKACPTGVALGSSGNCAMPSMPQKVEPVAPARPSEVRKVRSAPGSGKPWAAPDGRKRDAPWCYNCNQAGHIAATCLQPCQAVTSKAAAVTNVQDSDEEPVVTGARAQVASGDKDEGLEPASEGASDEYESADSLWERFNNTYSLSTRVCTIVPLEHDVTGCVTKVQGRQPDPEAEPIHAPGVRRRPEAPPTGQPVWIPREQQPLTGHFRMGNTLAHIMFDSGLGTDMVSPEFVCTTQLKPVKLKQPVGLQMALISSRGRINFGLNTRLEVGPIDWSHYFDIANIEKYDMILGMLFMKQNNVLLDFARDKIIVGTMRLPSCHRVDAPEHPAKSSKKARPAAPREATVSTRAKYAHSKVSEKGGE
jgi:hypothetical protein